jgi:cystathionine beta-lyase
VYYPGLPSDPFHEIAKKQMVLEEWFLLISSPVKEDAIGFLEKIKLFTLAESLGGVESLANYSVMMAHRFRR